MKTSLQAQIKQMNSVPRCNSGSNMVESGNLEMFPLTYKWLGVNTTALCEVIVKHLKILEQNMSFYFSSATTEYLDWVRDPFSSAPAVGKDMTLQEQEELTELK